MTEGKTCLITGGAGGIGLEVARLLGEMANVKLGLVNRSKMPDRSLLEPIISKNEDNSLCHKIRMIKLIEKRGSIVELYSADITDIEQAASVIDFIRKKHGVINGIIHSAGLGGKGLFVDKKIEVFGSVMETKVKGAWILDKVTEDMSVDFMVMFSSTLALIGIEGQGDYASGNAYLDVFTQSRRNRGKKTLTINWPGWKETGMAVNFDFPEDRFEEIFFQSNGTDEALSALRLLLGKRITNSMVSGTLMKISKYYYDSLYTSFEVSEQISSKMIFHAGRGKDSDIVDVILSGRENNEYSDFERSIGSIWCSIFGKQELNISESYFDLGGDSIISTVMNRYINGGIA